MPAKSGTVGCKWRRGAAKVDGPVNGFPSFVRFTWYAEVRYPPEMRREPGALDEASPFGIECL